MLSFRHNANRREFLAAGALLGGLTLADVLRLRARAAAPRSHKSVILIYLGGGPSHIDMYDMKPAAPVEFRGEFQPIKTSVAGMDVCELMPLQAKIADKLAIVRGLKMSEPHGPHTVMTGFPERGKPGVLRPAFGSVVSKLQGDKGPRHLPAYVSFFSQVDSPFYEDPSYAGPAHRPFLPEGGGLRNLTLRPEIPVQRLDDRAALLKSFDNLQRDLDGKGDMLAVDDFQARALDMITSPKARAAFDVNLEPQHVRDKYGPAATRALQARRLVEAGVSVVTLRLGSTNWDTHSANFKTLRKLLPEVDQGVHALVTDLHERGLDKDVAVIMWGEFGRTPRIGDTAPDGRGHWTPASCALLAGGGLRTGQVVGETDDKAALAKGRPFTAQNIFATLYNVLGINPALTTLDDNSGRPQYLLDDAEPIKALI